MTLNLLVVSTSIAPTEDSEMHLRFCRDMHYFLRRRKLILYISFSRISTRVDNAATGVFCAPPSFLLSVLYYYYPNASAYDYRNLPIPVLIVTVNTQTLLRFSRRKGSTHTGD